MTLDNNDHLLLMRPFEWLTSPGSLRSILSTISEGNKTALHIGSGSSTVGEFLVEELSYHLVIDVDKDEETLQRMKQRWHERCLKTGVDQSRLQHVNVDFTKSSIEQAQDASFSLVLDKSTLDCTLCSEHATAALLVEVYRCMAVGGCYLLISFHEKDLLLPLLRDLPGADWVVTCQTMARQVERLDDHSNLESKNPISEDSATSHGTDTYSSHHSPLNVLLAQKMEGEGNHHLSIDQTIDHVHRVNDSWFQQSRPLLTRQRHQQLQSSFSLPLPLPEAYQCLFTEAEREQLTYEYFLEDWNAFCEKRNCQVDSRIDFDVAIEFLKEMQ